MNPGVLAFFVVLCVALLCAVYHQWMTIKTLSKSLDDVWDLARRRREENEAIRKQYIAIVLRQFEDPEEEEDYDDENS